MGEASKLKYTPAQLDEMKRRVSLSSLIGTTVALSRNGREFEALCPFHTENTRSFTVSDDKSFFHCFGCGAHGDHLDYLQERHGLTWLAAADYLSQWAGVAPDIQTRAIESARQPEPIWTPICPVPADAPDIVQDDGTFKVYNPKRAGTPKEWASLRPDMVHAYRSIDGELLGYVLRCLFSDGGKFTPQVTFCSNAAGERRWCMISFPEPRPLYGLESLKRSTSGNVLIVEGEKCADAAQPLFKFAVLSWPGGTNGIGHVDWTPLAGKKPMIWPDADEPGAHAAEGRWNVRRGEAELGVAQLALAAGAVGVRIVDIPDDVPKGWDVADAIAEGWDKTRILDFVKARVREHREPTAPPADETHTDAVAVADAPQRAPAGADGGPCDNEPPPITEDDSSAGQRDDQESAASGTGAALVLVKGGPKAEKQGVIPAPSIPGATEAEIAEKNGYLDANLHFRLVGHEMAAGEHVFCFLTIGGGRVLRYSASKLSMKANLMSLAPLSWWEELYPGTRSSKLDMDSATNALVQRCYRVGPFNPERLRGRGAWWDRKKNLAVLNLGNVLLDGKVMTGNDPGIDPTRYKSDYIYERTDAFSPPHAEPLDRHQAKQLFSLCDLLSWENKLSAYLLAGWCAIAPICGALDWRPSVWMLGPSGCGKGWIINNIVTPIVGDWAILAEGDTTAAGLVQNALRSDARPIIFDEAEAENERGIARIRDILFLMRIASSSSGGRQYKGTSDGRGRSTTARTCFFFASINQSMTQAPDKSRVTTLELTKNESISDFERIKEFARTFCTAEFGSRLLARTISLIPIIRKNAETFATVLAEKHDRRIGDQLGTILAGAYSLFSDDLITPEGVAKYLDGKNWGAQTTIESEPDEQRMLAHLMQASVRVHSSNTNFDVPVGEMIMTASGSNDNHLLGKDAAEIEMKRLGIKLAEGGFMVSNTSSAIKRFFKGTSWEANWAVPMARLKGARKMEKVQNFGPGARARAIYVPLTIIDNKEASEMEAAK